jgi:hypothetical protein
MATRSRSKKSTPSRHSRVMKTGKLEENVDAILRSRGLELNAAPEKLLERTKRGGLFAADGAKRRKGEKTIRRNIALVKTGAIRGRRAKPTRGKQLRDARRA